MRKRPRSLVCHTNTNGILQRDVLQKVKDASLSAVCVQKGIGWDFTITFKTLEDCRHFEFVGTEEIEDFRPNFPRIRPQRQRFTTYVSIFRAPMEMKLKVIERICSSFREVRAVRQQKIHREDTFNGIISVIMVLEKPMPSNITIGAYNLDILHDNQPPTC
eukprot:Seg5516.4 transcript_id=Seg5516.4/GoldUCD/mRNA.D3Y31 product="hypothetical protein" protein_id=Seg5516.4/GoldUCD/D3Y31